MDYPLATAAEARLALQQILPELNSTKGVENLGSETRYQFRVASLLNEKCCLRPNQMELEARILIDNPRTEYFREANKRLKNNILVERIVDIALFSNEFEGDFCPTDRKKMIANAKLFLEIKSVAFSGKLPHGEIIKDLDKLKALREELHFMGSDLIPVMMVFDTTRERKYQIRPQQKGKRSFWQAYSRG